jgi:hypothetical protein
MQINKSIRHTVVFKLKHAKGSPEEKSFLNAAMKLAAIPGVENLECMKQVSPKNNFDFGLSMEFASQQVYDLYNSHPDHTAFVQSRWLKEVVDFMEIDYQTIDPKSF